MDDLDQLCIDTLRFLAVDAVEAAQSGHPGMPLGASPLAYTLWDRFLRHSPTNPQWFNRDRFILSAGHASAMLYALLHMTGYDLPLEELKRFRQWESKTPGHPEYGLTPGVEATTGPLGQGFGMGVGMAIAERFLAAHFNRPGFDVVDHHTYVICSDGDLMEGVASEAASLAGHLRLGKLVCLYDDNDISIEGSTELTFTEQVGARFRAYGWHVQQVRDGNDTDPIAAALRAGQEEAEHPSLIIVRTHIGFGSPRQDSEKAHGEPLGPGAAAATKQALGWPQEPAFYLPDEAAAHMREAASRGAELEAAWNELVARYRTAHPDLAAEFDHAVAGELPEDWDADLPEWGAEDGPMATRNASGEVLNALARRLPALIGGSADLAPSTRTLLDGEADANADTPAGRNLHFGVREHAMGAAVNGMALHGGVIPYGATFLVFSDYLRPSLRLACIMQSHSLFVFTHDSIGVGEDGPTHQPVEHLASLRAMPGMMVMRPADANETVAAWRVAIRQRGPVAFALSRQKLPVLDPDRYHVSQGVPHGGYVLAEAAGSPLDLIIIATGSEVHLALEAREALMSRGVAARVVSMPCCELFDRQSSEYRQEALPAGVPKLAVEAGATLGWWKYVGEHGDVIGLDRFGASAPGDLAMHNLGFNVQNLVTRVLALLGKGQG